MRTSTRRFLALTATISLAGAACGSDANDSGSADDTTPATEAPTTEAMDEAPTTEAMDEAPTTDAMDEAPTTDAMADDDAMDDDAMDDDAMDDDAMADDGAMDDDAMADDAADGPTTDDGASSLRAGLTSLLQEHVYLAGIAIETAVDAGGDLEEPATAAAVAALDENSVALADAVGSIAGPENGDAFLGLWREHIGFFVDYTLARATGDDAAAEQARTDLDGYKQAAGAFFEEITGGELPADALVENLNGHTETVFAAIDAVVAGEPTAFADLRMAAQHMFGSALALSGAITAAVPESFPGDVESAPAETRAVLTNLLQEHVYLAGIAIEQAVEAGGDMEAPAVVAAVETLDANSVALSEVITSVAGAENGEAFLGLWREHIGFFVDYTLGRATGDDAMAEQALTDLDGYQEAAGAFFEEITGGALPSDALIASLDEHVSTLTTAIDSLVAGDPAVFTELRAAAQHMPMAALALSTAVVEATG